MVVVMRSTRAGIRSDDHHDGADLDDTVKTQNMRMMSPAPKPLLSMLLLISLVFSSVVATAVVAIDNYDYAKCETAVAEWAVAAVAAFSIDETVKGDKHALHDLLFFLHIPRTGGRTYFHCFLRKLYASYMECPRSYDKLRFDPSKPNCRLMSTHDDYSIMSRLPRERTSVVTVLRSPVDRVFSSYEFSVEVAARFLVHPNLTSVSKMARRVRRKSNGVSTLDIWPWKYLVPWMREDLFARRDARKHGDFKNKNKSNDPYDMKEIVMPLHKFINDPIAHDIVHNGATFQVAGLTNNSYFEEAYVVRRCVGKHQALGEYVLDVAKVSVTLAEEVGRYVICWTH
ncbi:hypothetical protein Sjap_013850 [Stephania japonica]|uniref:Sulfotransferase n=1 Tax=Stephania japonica TaxID=461633 RepID=A0AAP0J0H7_9MAGN